MNSPSASPPLWSARRLGVVIVLSVAAQFLLVWLFSARAPLAVRPADARPVHRLAAQWNSEFFRLASPVLFARPSALGFSGRVWLTPPEMDYRPPTATAGAAWLIPDRAGLAAEFGEFVRTNRPARVTAALRPVPQPVLPAVAALPAARTRSWVEMDADLAPPGQSPLPELPAWPHAEALQPTEVRVLVDADGHPVSAVVLRGSGLATADAFALEAVQQARFGARPSPADGPTGALRAGRLEFHWLTLPPAEGDGGDPR